MTAPSDAQWLAMSKALQSIIQRPDAEPFRVPVEWKALGLFDYPQVVKRPMDLGTVKKKITDRKYKSLQEACDDIRLVWTNCMTYNADGSDFFKLAKSLSKRWEDKYSRLMTDLQLDGSSSSSAHNNNNPHHQSSSSAPALDGGGDGASKISLDEKRAFARSLYKINKDDLGKLIVEVDTKCPAALVKNSAEDECELNVDKISPALFQELKQFVANCKVATTTKKKGGASSSSGSKRQKT